jgi:hypothetical protein
MSYVIIRKAEVDDKRCRMIKLYLNITKRAGDSRPIAKVLKVATK